MNKPLKVYAFIGFFLFLTSCATKAPLEPQDIYAVTVELVEDGKPIDASMVVTKVGVEGTVQSQGKVSGGKNPALSEGFQDKGFKVTVSPNDAVSVYLTISTWKNIQWANKSKTEHAINTRVKVPLNGEKIELGKYNSSGDKYKETLVRVSVQKQEPTLKQ